MGLEGLGAPPSRDKKLDEKQSQHPGDYPAAYPIPLKQELDRNGDEIHYCSLGQRHQSEPGGDLTAGFRVFDGAFERGAVDRADVAAPAHREGVIIELDT